MPTGVGIDLGSDAIKLAVVRTGGERPQLLAAAKIPRPDAGDTKDGDIPAITPDLVEAVRKSKARRGGGLLGITGRDLMMKFSSVPPVPPWKLQMLMEYEIRENQATGMSDICHDFRLLNLGGRGLSGNLLALVAIAKNEYVRAIFDQAGRAGLKPEAACPSAVGLYNAYMATGKRDAQETVVLLDIGHKYLEMVIVQNGELILARGTPGGGDAFTKAIDSAMKVGRKRAESFKHERARVSSEVQPDADREMLLLSTSLREAADAILNAVRSSIMFARVQTKIQKLDLDRLVISGGSARMSGLSEYIEKKLGKPVEVFDPADGFDLRKADNDSARLFDDSPGEMTVALGLAIAAGQPDAWKLELLPEDLAAKRAFWRSTVWAYAAGALLAVALAVGFVRAKGELAAVKDKTDGVAGMVTDYRQEAKDYENRKNANADLRAEVQLLRARTRYGVTVLEFLRTLRSVTPDGINLSAVFEPRESTSGGGMIELLVEGRLDTTRIEKPYDELDKYMGKLKEAPFISSASVTTQRADDGGGRGGRGGGAPAPGGRMPFSFKVDLDPAKIKIAAEGGEAQ